MSIFSEARDFDVRLVFPLIHGNLKIFYGKCCQEKLYAEFTVRGEAHGISQQGTYRTFKILTSLNHYVHIITHRNLDQRM